ncbi:MAG TPA: hypothetical protein DCX43_01585, partial [Psychrobacter sp.]|nr:hypothetical protein [Psychrobacter sp.]
AVASAGWSAVNELANVIEFVSPSAAMSDYRLGIDDSTPTKTDWYYQYQDVRTNPNYNSPIKNPDYINEAHASNGWTLLVADRGLYFLEHFYSTLVDAISSRMTYIGQIKSGLIDNTGVNIAFFNIGHSATTPYSERFYNSSYTHYRLGAYTKLKICSATPFDSELDTYQYGVSVIDMASEIYLSKGVSPDVLLAQQPALLSKVVNSTADLFGVLETTLDARPVLSVGLGGTESSALALNSSARAFILRLDYWEY